MGKLGWHAAKWPRQDKSGKIREDTQNWSISACIQRKIDPSRSYVSVIQIQADLDIPLSVKWLFILPFVICSKYQVALINKHWSALAHCCPACVHVIAIKRVVLGVNWQHKAAWLRRVSVLGGDGRCRRCWCCYHRHKTLHHAVFCAAVFDGN